MDKAEKEAYTLLANITAVSAVLVAILLVSLIIALINCSPDYKIESGERIVIGDKIYKCTEHAPEEDK